MKNILISLILLMCFCMVFSFCGGDKKTTDSKDVSTPKAEEPKKDKEASLSYAIVESLKGEVVYSKMENAQPSDWKEVRQNQKLNEGDWVQTKDAAKCTLVVGEGNTLFLDSNSKVNIAKLIVDGKSIKDSSFNLKMGKLLAKTKNISPDGGLTVRTPSAVAGVRGTEFIVAHDEQKNISKVAVSEGTVAVARNVKLESTDVPEIKDFGKLISKTTNVTANEKLAISGEDNNKLVSTFNNAAQGTGKFDLKANQELINKTEVKVEKLSEAEVKDINTLKEEAKITSTEQPKPVQEPAIKKEEPKKPEQPKVNAPKAVVPQVQATDENKIKAGDLKGIRSKDDLGNNYRQSYITGQGSSKNVSIVPEIKRTDKKIDYVERQEAETTVDKKFIELEKAQREDIESLEK